MLSDLWIRCLSFKTKESCFSLKIQDLALSVPSASKNFWLLDFCFLYAINDFLFTCSTSFWYRELSTDEDVQTESKYGSIQFRLPGSPFSPTCGKDSAYFGKIFTLKLFEEMHVIGYDYMACADLSRAFDQGQAHHMFLRFPNMHTIFFTKFSLFLFFYKISRSFLLR